MKAPKSPLAILTTSLLITISIGACNSANDSKNNFNEKDGATNSPNVSTSVNQQITSLGEELFHDETLSRDGNQSCASCHNPDHAFIDDRINETSLSQSTPSSVSSGQDSAALGDRNTPTASYAAFIPDFHFDSSDELFKGG